MIAPETITEEAARERLDEIVERAREGDEFVVTRDGQPFARIVGRADDACNWFWKLEDAFWKADETFYAERLDPSCLMVFSAPTGILNRQDVIASIGEAPRWRTITMIEQVAQAPSDELYVLAYRAKAEREGATYDAYCSSTYRYVDERWMLFLHQQTPVHD